MTETDLEHLGLQGPGVELLGCRLHCCCSVAEWCPTLCDSMDCCTPGLPVPHHLLKFAQVHIHCIDDAVKMQIALRPCI